MAHPGGRDLLNRRPAVDYDAILAEMLAPLGAEAFPVATWTPQAIVSSYIFPKKFVAHVKPLTAEGDPAIRTAIIGKGSAMEFWSSPGTCTVAQMYDFCSWLKSGEGAQFLNETRRKRALERKSLRKGLSFQEASFIYAMDAQVLEFSVASKKARAEDLADIKVDYTPASGYEPMDGMELGAACLALYQAACARENMDEAELDQDLMADVKAAYGKEAVARHKLEFLQEGGRQEELRVWFADKIVQLSEAWDRRKANRLRTYLEAMGGEVSAQTGGGGRNLRRAREGPDAGNALDHPCRRRLELEGEAVLSTPKLRFSCSMAHPRGRAVINPRSPVDYDAILAETLAPLAAEAFPVATWTRQAIVLNFTDVKNFVAHVKLLTTESDPAIRTTIIGKGSAMEFWSTPQTCTVAQMFKFCVWLKSDDGTQFLNDTRRNWALLRNPKQVSQISRCKKVAEMDETVARLQREIVLMQECRDRELAALRANYAPASAYEPMDDMELGAACFALYRAECARENKDEAELDEDLLADIKALYGNEVAIRHKLEFLREGTREEELRVWAADKIVQLIEAGDRKKANRIRIYLEAMGGEVSAQVRKKLAAAGEQEQATAGGEGGNGGTSPGPGPAAQ